MAPADADAPVRADREPRRRRADRRARRRDRAAQAARARLRRAPRVSGFGTCPLPPVARKDPDGDRAHQRRGPLRRPGRAARRRRPTTSSSRSSAPALVRLRRLRRAVRQGARRADWDFYKIDPLLFSPAEVRSAAVRARVPRRRARARRAGALVRGLMRVGVLGATGSWHSRRLGEALAASRPRRRDDPGDAAWRGRRRLRARGRRAARA